MGEKGLDFKHKEVINITDAKRLGYVQDVTADLKTGVITSIIVPGNNKRFNIFSKPHFISYGIDDCDYSLLKKYRRKGYFIIGWTYKSEENKLKLKAVYDNMIIEGLAIKEF